MAAARTTPKGLSRDDLETIRRELDAGRKPKVMFTPAAGQIAGQQGRVVAMTDPQESDEFVVVQFGRDELPFAPGDLMIPPKPAKRRPQPEQKTPVSVPASTPDPAPTTQRTTTEPAPRSEVREDTTVTTNQSTADSKPARRKTGKTMKAKAASFAVTIGYADGEWTVTAHQGSKALVKQSVIKPADALKMVALIDVPAVQEAVQQILAAERAEAERQAERLRAELAEIEARLAELPDVS